MDEYNHKLRQFQVIRWDVLRMKKQQKLDEAKERVRLRRIGLLWTLMKRTREVLTIIYAQFT